MFERSEPTREDSLGTTGMKRLTPLLSPGAVAVMPFAGVVFALLGRLGFTFLGGVRGRAIRVQLGPGGPCGCGGGGVLG